VGPQAHRCVPQDVACAGCGNFSDIQRGGFRISVLSARHAAPSSVVERPVPIMIPAMTPRVRIALKLAIAAGMILVLVLFSATGVDFVYTGF